MATRSELLQRRLIDFSIAVCELAHRMPRDAGGDDLSRQLARAAMSPAANYAEARDAESSRDYAHKVKLCVKELRETAVWLAMTRALHHAPAAERLERECDELTAILVTCLKKARRQD